VFSVDEGCRTAEFLHFGDNLQRQGRLARGLRTVDLDHSATRKTADSESNVQPQRAGGDNRNIGHHAALAHLHDRALAKLLFDLGQRCSQRLCLVIVHYQSPCLSERNYPMFEGTEDAHLRSNADCHYIQ
jgi:hypothetical protein